ncbi:hypothetical protein AB0M44_36480 [Streptosporangium subroseum]|uniref:hypothetical protein n=1 Tax=Streptosporangium subroseum TaxID=106412 RepID=UPI00343B49AB
MRSHRKDFGRTWHLESGPRCPVMPRPSSEGVPLRFTVTMMCEPGKPMLTLVDDEELAQRRDRRFPRRS